MTVSTTLKITARVGKKLRLIFLEIKTLANEGPFSKIFRQKANDLVPKQMCYIKKVMLP